MSRLNHFYTLDPDLIREQFGAATSFVDLLRRLGSREAGQNRRILKRRLVELGIDPQPLCEKGARSCRTFLGQGEKEPELTVSSHTSRSVVKKYLLRKGLITYECSECSMGPEWRGKKLTLILDHINGVHDDHRLENLRFLCPNCNAQTDTFTGANRQRHDGTLRPVRPSKDPSLYNLCGCGASKRKPAKTCKVCTSRTKIEWPSIEELAERVKITPMLALSKELGVSDKGLAKHLKKHGVATPNRGFWAKQNVKDKQGCGEMVDTLSFDLSL